MRNCFSIFFAFLVAIVTVSCTTFRISGIEYARRAAVENVIGDFDITVRLHQFFGVSNGMHLANIAARAMDPVIVDAIRAEIATQGGSRAVNVRVTYQASFADLLLNHLTVRVWAPATVRVTGTVVR